MQPAIEAGENIGTCYPMPYGSAQQPGSQNDANSIGDDHIGMTKSLVKNLISTGDFIGVGIETDEVTTLSWFFQSRDDLLDTCLQVTIVYWITKNIFLYEHVYPVCKKQRYYLLRPAAVFLRLLS